MRKVAAEPELFERLASGLPDIPRFVETRSMLILNRCEVTGIDGRGSLNFVVRNVETGLISIIGKPPVDAITEVVEAGGGGGTVLAFDNNLSDVKEALPRRQFERATLHLLGHAPLLPEVPVGTVRILSLEEVERLEDVPVECRGEMVIEARHTHIAA